MSFILKPIVLVFLCVTVLFFSGFSQIQPESNEAIKEIIESLKTDARGPFQDIRWYCVDGTNVGLKERCPQPGAIQHGNLKSNIQALEKSNGLYVGQILAGTDNIEFWNPEVFNSQLKQYQIEHYLRNIDNGWIWRKGQYFQGALQAEDEDAWGTQYFDWLLAQDEPIEKYFYLVRQSLKDIPHAEDDSLIQLIRSQSKLLSDDFPAFMDVRVKINSQFDTNDGRLVKEFIEKYRSKLSESLIKRLNGLTANIESYYQPVGIRDLKKFVLQLPEKNTLKGALTQYIHKYENSTEPSQQQLTISAAMMWRCRIETMHQKDAKTRLALLELSLKLEQIIIQNASKIKTPSLKQLTRKIHALALASAASGALEVWEWEELSNRLKPSLAEEISLLSLNDFLSAAQSAVEWGAGMVKATYEPTVQIFSDFEPLTNGFIDNRIHSSLTYALGQSTMQLNEVIARESGIKNEVFNLENPNDMFGLNPGFARGELVLVESAENGNELFPDKIYFFQGVSFGLESVAGVATVNGGNLASSTQLLAKNLEIPNAWLSEEMFQKLKPMQGQRIFFAVSLNGKVIMKLESEMTADERQLFISKQRNETKIKIESGTVKLDQLNILDLSNNKLLDSGKGFGPKTIDLASLKVEFPENVLNGLAIPFGVFKAHMDQEMPGKNQSYWQFLTDVLSKGNQMRGFGVSEAEVDGYELRELNVLREAIKRMPLLPTFLLDIQHSFETVFGKHMGDIPVFLRSETNLDDLMESNAGALNLSLVNVLEAEKILQGIRDSWASIYSDRSYKWRQKYLLNPTYVFPSILITPSVDEDYSGVLITKGIKNRKEEDLTIRFCRGIGQASKNQLAETRLLRLDGSEELTAPSRNPFYTKLLSIGGSETVNATFDQPILNELNRVEINQLTQSLRSQLPSSPNFGFEGPYEVELRFKDDHLWLFQVHSFLGSKQAQRLFYLDSITPQVDPEKMISLNMKV